MFFCSRCGNNGTVVAFDVFKYFHRFFVIEIFEDIDLLFIILKSLDYFGDICCVDFFEDVFLKISR